MNRFSIRLPGFLRAACPVVSGVGPFSYYTLIAGKAQYNFLLIFCSCHCQQSIPGCLRTFWIVLCKKVCYTFGIIAAEAGAFHLYLHSFLKQKGAHPAEGNI